MDGWRKSSYSGSQGSCVEVAGDAQAIMVRDTTDRDGATLSVPSSAWSRFLGMIR
jgi:hypothetical protein